MREKVSVDAIDRRILDFLQSEPDCTIADIANRIGLSQTPCWRRLKRLQETGVIAERVWRLDPEALGLSVNVFAEVRLKQHDEETLEAFETQTVALPEVVACFSMSGQSDYLLRIVIGSVGDYELLLKRVLLHLPGVGSINSSFALKALKISTRLPIRFD